MVGAYCLLVPAKAPPPQPMRIVRDAPSAVASTRRAADIEAGREAARAQEPPQAIRLGTVEFRIEDGRPPVLRSWEEGLYPNQVRTRRKVEAISKGRVPADWDSVDRAWTEDEVLNAQPDALVPDHTGRVTYTYPWDMKQRRPL